MFQEAIFRDEDMATGLSERRPRKWKAPAPGAWSEGHQALLREVNCEARPGNRGKTRSGPPQLQSWI